MLFTKTRIRAVILEKPEPYEYKYKVFAGGSNLIAFRTEAGFDDWCKRMRFSIADEVTSKCIRTGGDFTHITFDLGSRLHEHSFWSLDDLPTNRTPFTGLCNGSYVTCYMAYDEDGTHVYRPNPNATDVYNPLPLEERIKFAKEFG